MSAHQAGQSAAVAPVLILVVVFSAAACLGSDRRSDHDEKMDDGEMVPAKSPAAVRARRRAYNGAPPVIPHASMGAACVQCHNQRGMEVEGVGFAPPSPHADTRGMGETARCRQCHVFALSRGIFAENQFIGLAQNLRPGPRLYAGAPPVIPHRVFMRENCVACHDGAAARDVIRTSHPERTRCQQCHAQRVALERFER